jgi:tryptophanyl-tRNA synthetase
VRCLIPCAIDQDNYFRMTREIAPRMHEFKPALIHSKFFPSLQGHDAKMSASDTDSAIFLADSPADIVRKIGAALSGGGDTMELHRLHGANLAVDIPYAYLRFVLEDDDELALITSEYGAGRMSTTAVKQRLCKILVEITQRHQKARAAISDDLVKVFMTPRPLSFPHRR